jgi:CDK inhibitor PHO81
VETYWKSMSTPAAGKGTKTPRAGHRMTSSAQTSPSVQSLTLGAGTGSMALSSLRGDYVHAVIQVTRDRVPVVFSRWTLPFDGAVDLGVADLTLAQLLRIAEKENLIHDTHHNWPTSTSEWAESLSTHIIPLKDLLKVCRLLSLSPVNHRWSCTRSYHLSWGSVLN